MPELHDPVRLDALSRSGLMRKDTPERLTHVCYTVTQLLNCDVAMLNVVTATEQRFIAEWPRVSPKRYPFLDLDDSGCKEVILGDATIVISDTRAHPVMCQMPWSALWQGYMSAPVRYDGQPVGTLCALTVGKRPWSVQDQSALETLAKLIEDSLRVMHEEQESA